MNNQEQQDLVRQLRDSISDLTAYVSMEPQPKDADDYRWTIKVQEIALEALTAEPVKVPDKWYFQLTFDIPNLEKMTPYQAHGAAWEQCRAEVLRLNNGSVTDE